MDSSRVLQWSAIAVTVVALSLTFYDIFSSYGKQAGIEYEQNETVTSLEQKVQQLEAELIEFKNKTTSRPSHNTSRESPQDTSSDYDKIFEKLDMLEDKIDKMNPQVIIMSPSLSDSFPTAIAPAIITGVFALISFKLRKKKT